LVPLWGKILVGLYLVLVGGTLIYLLIAVWPAVHSATTATETSQTSGADTTISVFGASYSPDSDVALLLLVAVLSALGSYVHAATSFVDFAGNRRLVVSWIWWYVFRILIGVSLAEIFYFAIRAGFLGTDTPASDINPYGIAAIAGLVGLFSKQATDKLSEVFTTLFRTEPHTGDNTRDDGLANPEPVALEVEPPKLDVNSTLLDITLRGEGFVDVSAVRVSRPSLEGGSPVPREVKYVSPNELTVTLKPEDVAEAGSLSLTVFNPPPGGGTSDPVLLVVA
jgi:hypothetical protein